MGLVLPALGKVLILTFSAYILTAALVPALLRLLRQGGALVVNYRGRPVATAGGLTVILGAAPPLFFSPSSPAFLAAFWGMALLGLLDDLLGSRETRGLAGHFTRLIRGELTTGALKALGGGILALWLAAGAEVGTVPVILAALLIALTANILNLLDLKPGRALKFFWLGACALIWFRPAEALYLYPLVGASLAYLPREMAEEVMLGDTGANALGLALGAAAVLVLPFPAQAFLAVGLTALHLYAEKYSLSRAIETTPWLCFLDQIGMERQEN